MSRGFIITLGIIGAVVLAAVFPVFINVRDGKGHASIKTVVELKNIAIASQLYFQEYGRWPTSFGDFTNNPQKIIFMEFEEPLVLDGWKRPILYRPYDTNLGYGSVISLGKDGKPGGTGSDADLEIQFNVKNEEPKLIPKL